MTAITLDEARRRWLGVAFMCAGVFVFTIQDLIIKDISGLYPVHEIVFVRSFVSLPVILAIAYVEHGIARLSTLRLKEHALRGSVMFLAYTTYYLGIAALPLATTVAISFSAPLFITALAVPILGERVGPVRWLAVVIGFIGVLIVMWDKIGTVEFAVVLPMFSALCYALAQIHARYIGATESAPTLAFYSTIVFLILSGLAGLFTGTGALDHWTHPSLAFLLRPWSWPEPQHLALMLACGLIAGIGIYCLSQGYRLAQANEAALFEYTALPWAILWGYLFFSEIPFLTTYLGVALVILAGLSIAWRERRLP
jgi:drug/metabolite transporter (DMT)-like permease